MSTSIFNTQCNVCYIAFDKIENLNLHIKNIHHETDSIRLDRLEHSLGSAFNKKPSVIVSNKMKQFDCSE